MPRRKRMEETRDESQLKRTLKKMTYGQELSLRNGERVRSDLRVYPVSPDSEDDPAVQPDLDPLGLYPAQDQMCSPRFTRADSCTKALPGWNPHIFNARKVNSGEADDFSGGMIAQLDQEKDEEVEGGGENFLTIARDYITKSFV